jgi:hypothetical protein
MTPSSAATTSTTMSVAWAPRARIGGERRVARRVDEGHHGAAVRASRTAIGPDVLGDAARLALAPRVDDAQPRPSSEVLPWST